MTVKGLFIAGLIALSLDAGAILGARAAPSSQVRPRFHVNALSPKLPDAVLRYRFLMKPPVTPYQACETAKAHTPGSVCLSVRRTLPSGDFLVTVRAKNKVRRLRVCAR